MTLYRQLIIFTLVLFFLLFFGTWLAKLESTRSFLMDQLESHAQDTATSLGLSVSQYINEDDLAVVDSMVNAVFDRGYYRIIKLIDMEGKVIIEQTMDVTIKNVPTWFINLIPLKTPTASANIMAGWHQAGTIRVTSHPGYAYKALWEAAVRMSLWFVVTGVFVTIIGSLGLRILLKPLDRVESQADALCRKQYEIQEQLPRTKELRRVVEAMNRMTYKVKEMFEEQVGIAERLRKDAYRDSLTGLGNRRYFGIQINSHLESSETDIKGVVLLVQIHNLQELNQQKGFQAGDALLKKVTKSIQEATTQVASCALARLTGGDFGIFLPDASAWDAEHIAAAITNNICRLTAEQLTISDNICHVGAATFDFSVTFERLLSEADLALRSAQQAGPNTWKIRTISEDSDDTPLGEQQWKAAIDHALEKRQLILFGQSVVKTEDKSELLHLEVFSRIVQEDGKLVTAGVFLPFAERLKLVSSLDRMVLEKLFAFILAEHEINTFAVNLSPTSLRDDSFIQWIQASLSDLADTTPRIIFEFPEFSALQDLDRVKEFSAMVRELNQGIGLDHYGQSFSNLGYLQSLRPDYVKIDRAYTSELKEEENDSRFFISTLCSVAHSLDIAVIAEGIETEKQWEILKEMNLDAVQGYFIERPKEIGS